MAKILLVEDDNNLREIYQARLEAEGYVIVVAKDGEEGLVVAKKERPDAAVVDAMMPRVSGFEFADIIRNTPELKDIHIIMLTALGQAEDKTRANSLGIDRYLVKSQVTLEDIVKTVADVLAGAPVNATAAAAAVAEPAAATANDPTAIPVASAPADNTAAANASVDTVTNIPVATPPPVAPAPAPTSQPADTAASVATTPADTPAPSPPAAPTEPPKITIPVSAVPTPVNATAAAAPTPIAASDDQLMTDAMKDLIASTSNPAATVPVEPAGPPPPPAAAAPAVPITPPVAPIPNLIPQDITPPAPPAAPAPAVPMPPPPAATPAAPPIPPISDDSDNAPVANKKIIQPIAPVAGAPAPTTDLSELLAKENIGHMDDAHPATGFLNPNSTDHPHTPGNIISPTAASPTQSTMQNPNDPNSIAL